MLISEPWFHDDDGVCLDLVSIYAYSKQCALCLASNKVMGKGTCIGF